MSKKWKVVVGVIVAVVAFTGFGLLCWGGAVYRLSDGERGWSLGASIYQALGWGTAAYRSDFGWDEEGAGWASECEVDLVDDDEDSVPDRAVVESSADQRRRFGRGIGRRRDRGGHAFFVGGMGCLAFWVLLGLIGLGVVLFRRWRDARPSASVAGE